jgi:hypothetical protein
MPLAFVSITITGFRFGIGDNIFHIPYVLNLPESPEFADDAFYSTLKHYTSIIWPLLRLISNETNIEDVFYWANFLSRAVAFAGILFLLRENGLNSIVSMTIGMIVIALTRLLQGFSVGDHKMFIGYFSHTETTWGLVFVSLGLFSQNRLTSASAVTGAIFSINAFVGIWLSFANSFSLLYLQKRIEYMAAMKAVGAFLLLASPAVVWIMFAIDGDRPTVHFSQLNYIREFYPKHFLIEAISWKALAVFILVFVNGVIAAQFLLNRRYWIGVQIGLIVVFCVGIPLPYLFDNRFVFNLHLLRSAGVEQAIAVILSLIAGVKLILRTETCRNQVLGVIVLVCVATFDLSISTLGVMALALFVGFCSSQDRAMNDQSSLSRLVKGQPTVLVLFWLTIVGFVLALSRQVGWHQIGTPQLFLLIFVVSTFSIFLYQGFSVSARLNLLALVLIILSVSTMANAIHGRERNLEIKQEDASAKASLSELIDWIRSSSFHGIFLVPVTNGHSEDELSGGFQLHARRRVWVEWEQGAAVMWAPSFYDQWMQRFKEVSALQTPDDFVLYAQNHGIRNIVLRSDTEACPAPSRLVRSTQHYVLCVI